RRPTEPHREFRSHIRTICKPGCDGTGRQPCPDWPGARIIGDRTPRSRAATEVIVAVRSSIGEPSVNLSTTTLTFPKQQIGIKSAAQQVTLSNSGAASLTIASIKASGDFEETDNCGTAVPSPGTCTINVTFTPSAPGVRT